MAECRGDMVEKAYAWKRKKENLDDANEEFKSAPILVGKKAVWNDRLDA